MGWPMSCCKTHSIHRTASPDVLVLFLLFAMSFPVLVSFVERPLGAPTTICVRIDMQYTRALSVHVKYVIIADTFKTMFSIASNNLHSR